MVIGCILKYVPRKNYNNSNIFNFRESSTLNLVKKSLNR